MIQYTYKIFVSIIGLMMSDLPDPLHNLPSTFARVTNVYSHFHPLVKYRTNISKCHDISTGLAALTDYFLPQEIVLFLTS